MCQWKAGTDPSCNSKAAALSSTRKSCFPLVDVNLITKAIRCLFSEIEGGAKRRDIYHGL